MIFMFKNALQSTIYLQYLLKLNYLQTLEIDFWLLKFHSLLRKYTSDIINRRRKTK